MKVICMNNSQRGLTLVELMIAMLLGLFLIGGLLQIFISSQQTNRMQESLSRLQENGRFAIDFIARDLRMAGFLGCAEATNDFFPKPIKEVPIILPVIEDPTNANTITGNDSITNNWKATACSIDNKCIAETDAISMRHADSCGGSLTHPQASRTGNIQISDNTCAIKDGDVLIIADCKGADIFRATKANPPPPTKKANPTIIGHSVFPSPYPANAELFKYNDHSYFIRTGAGGRPALWMLDNTQDSVGDNPVELVEGVEDMQILYGVDTEMDSTKNPPCVECAPNYYVPANAVTVADWAKVVSVRISLLAATIDEPASKPLAYTYNGKTYDGDANPLPTDRRLRRVFNSTIAVRNRLP